jgi:hypothetical protein
MVISLLRVVNTSQSFLSVSNPVVNEPSNDDEHLSYSKVDEKEDKIPSKQNDYYEKLELRRQEMIKIQEEKRREAEGKIVERLARDNKDLIEIEKNFNVLREKNTKKNEIKTNKDGDRTYTPEDYVYKRFPYRNPINYLN